ncbi:MAG: tRNA (adenine22-N1)-methyltransferase [Psychromonas sp.]|uniref:tRNA (adenine(22)-N(1))-methyltransferase n=1 Tax=Psychromonas sp. TaxID=1884585 RepID=UPI0039E4758D
MKTGLRLQKIEQIITRRYDHIWDCCCDHGLLGFNLLKAQAAQTVHFIDIVPALLTQIENTLQNHWQGDRQAWQVHCIDAGVLPITACSTQPETDTHLIIIAGIGGELLIELMQSLLLLSENHPIEFILCPVHHNYKVRQFLINNKLGLLNEALVFENGRGYEIVHVSCNSGQPLSAVGSIMWDFSDPLHRNYLHKTIGHYQRIAKNPNADVTSILKQYQQLR